MGSPKRKTKQRQSRLSAKEYAQGIRRGDRVILSKAITLIESALPEDRKVAEEVLQLFSLQNDQSIRIGITGIPGVGKSTFINSFGKYLSSLNCKVAVLAIDPSSSKTKGSILGDKTRMEELSKDENAFIRPTSTGGFLGGVASHTRETILLCEAAGFDVIIVETVGVGQSEAAVRDMVDFFMLLMIGGAGDELQGIKKGIMEMADGIVITKADGENLKKAKQAQADYKHALHLFRATESGWIPKVLLTSAIEKSGLIEVWQMIQAFKELIQRSGYFQSQRIKQNINWFHSAIETSIKNKIVNSKAINKKVKSVEKKIAAGKVNPGIAANEVIEKFFMSLGKKRSKK